MKTGIKRELQKETSKRYITLGMFALLLIVFFVVLGYLLESERMDSSAGLDFHKLDMVGEYSLDDGNEWTSFKSLEELPQEFEVIELRGNFKESIPEDQSMIVYDYGIDMDIWINDNQVFDFGEAGQYPYAHSGGYTIWYKNAKNLDTDGITMDDQIEIYAKNIYFDSHPKQGYVYLNKMRYGDSVVFFKELRENAWEEIFCLAIIVVAFLVAGFSVVMFGKNVKQLCAGLAFSGFTFVCGLFCLVETVFEFMPLVVYNPVFCAYFDVFPIFFMVINFNLYVLFNLVGRNTIKVMYVASWITIAITIIACCIQLSGQKDLYEMQRYILIPGFFTIVTAFVCLVLDAVKYKNRHCLLLLAILSPYVIAIIAGSIKVDQAAQLMRYGIFFCSLLHIFEMGRFYLAQRRIEAAHIQTEKELIESRINVMQSQIQPHFLYNSLSTIQVLCDKDPKLAKDAIDHFSKYLRKNMNSLKVKECEPFERELEHLENYLFIEKLRFNDMLNIEYDIQTTNFLCPALSLQPLVENAVKYGVGQKEEGGTVKITTYEDWREYHIIVEDDGVGFDPSVKKDDGRIHVGMENTRQRLWEMCSGTMEVDSKIGEGTRVEIRIPKEKVTE